MPAIMRRFIAVLGLVGLCSLNPVYGVPLLQLDIANGTYDSGSDTIVSSGDTFDLFALFNTDKGRVSGTYYIAAAIVPKTQQSPPSEFGSFKVDGRTYSSANMTFGNPPAGAKSHSDLPSHGIYKTHYVEIGFTFDTAFSSANRSDSYNSEDDPGGLDPDSDGDLLYEKFTVDVSGLAAGYQVHFDLYQVARDKRGKYVKNFAPFSHDAQSGGGPLTVSDASSTMILLGMAMLAVEGMRRRFSR